MNHHNRKHVFIFVDFRPVCQNKTNLTIQAFFVVNYEREMKWKSNFFIFAIAPRLCHQENIFTVDLCKKKTVIVDRTSKKRQQILKSFESENYYWKVELSVPFRSRSLWK